MAIIPTDLQILSLIYNRHYQKFVNYSDDQKTRSSKIYVPIDIDEISKILKVDNDIIFGRLYYHLNQKYNYIKDDGSKVEFFSPRIAHDIHCVNFPYLAAVLADLTEQHEKHLVSTRIAIISLCLAGLSLVLSVLLNIFN
jgi:hypothetical protein